MMCIIAARISLRTNEMVTDMKSGGAAVRILPCSKTLEHEKAMASWAGVRLRAKIRLNYRRSVVDMVLASNTASFQANNVPPMHNPSQKATLRNRHVLDAVIKS